MSVSAIFGTRMVVTLPQTTPRFGGYSATKAVPGVGSTGLVIECSSRPTKKATAHHRKTRPKKTQPWDIRRKLAVYPPLPALPPEWSFAPVDEEAAAEEAPVEAVENDCYPQNAGISKKT